MEQINSKLRRVEDELMKTESACKTTNSSTISCTPCVCEYRNKLISTAVEEVNQILDLAKGDAMSLFETDMTSEAGKFLERTVNPWKNAIMCYDAWDSKLPVSNHKSQIM